MKTQLFIPKKIKVGYQERSDTYTKRLAYVIYYDDKGVLRKETSWRGWCHLEDKWGDTYVLNPNHGKPGEEYYLRTPDKKNYLTKYQLTQKGLGFDDYDNTPIEGFVLNRNGGGGRGWDGRNAFIRVWDPRGFEFEISVPNLLFILEHTTSYHGKGLEGKFVYSWEGKELVLLPEGCQEYKASLEFMALSTTSVRSKQLIEGATYLTKKDISLVYIGKRDVYTQQSYDKYHKKTRYANREDIIETIKTSAHIFHNGTDFITKSSVSDISKVIDENPVSNYAELAVEWYESKFGSKPVELVFEIKKIDFEDLSKKENYPNHSGITWIKNKQGVFQSLYFHSRFEGKYDGAKYVSKFQGFMINDVEESIKLDNNIVSCKYNGNWRYKEKSGLFSWNRDEQALFSKEDVESWETGDLYVVLESGVKIKKDEY